MLRSAKCKLIAQVVVTTSLQNWHNPGFIPSSLNQKVHQLRHHKPVNHLSIHHDSDTTSCYRIVRCNRHRKERAAMRESCGGTSPLTRSYTGSVNVMELLVFYYLYYLQGTSVSSGRSQVWFPAWASFYSWCDMTTTLVWLFWDAKEPLVTPKPFTLLLYPTPLSEFSLLSAFPGRHSGNT